jgi:hypothetical protein
MGSANYSVVMRAQPADVWRVYVDPSRISDSQTGSPVIEDISGAGEVPGTTYVSRRGPGTARTTVLEAIRPRRLVTPTQAYLGLQLDLVSELMSTGDGALLELRCARSGRRDVRCSANLSSWSFSVPWRQARSSHDSRRWWNRT